LPLPSAWGVFFACLSSQKNVVILDYSLGRLRAIIVSGLTIAGSKGDTCVLKYDFDESIGYWLTLAQQAYMRELGDALAPYGITFRQAQVLAYLSLDGPLAQSDLAARMSVEPPTLVGVLDRMERDGWVERTPCPDDGRRKLVRPLPAAERIWSKIVACGHATRQRAVSGLTDDEVHLLRQLLNKVTQNLRGDRPQSMPHETTLVTQK
jgi:MarR family transcriptional regulator for hemolysin